jgi:syntaxin 5
VSPFFTFSSIIFYSIVSYFTVAKKKTLFDDRPAEIQELTYIIKSDLGSLNRQIADLGELPRGRRHLQSHSSSVVLGLQSRLASMSANFKQVSEKH